MFYKDPEAETDPRSRTGRREEKIKQGELNDGKFVLKITLISIFKFSKPPKKKEDRFVTFFFDFLEFFFSRESDLTRPC